MKYNTLTKLFAISLGLASLYGCGGDSAFSVSTAQIGHGVGDSFTEGEIDITNPDLPTSGDNTVITVNVVDADGVFTNAPVVINFSSACALTGASTFNPAQATNTNGVVTTLYTNITCTNEDEILVSTASAPVLTATGTVTTTPSTTGGGTPATAGTSLLFGSGPNTSSFQNGVLDIQASTIDQQGTTIITAKIVDSATGFINTTDSLTVNFTSDCVGLGLSTFDQTAITNALGIYQVTYTHVDNACGSDNITASTTLTGTTVASTAVTTLNIVAGGGTVIPTAGVVSIGNGIGAGFSSAALNIANQTLTTGGNTLITANIVDENNLKDTGTYTVNFSVQCDNGGTFTLSNNSVTSATGTFSTTFTDTSCDGTVDVVAYAVLNGTTKTANGTITVGSSSTTITYSIGELVSAGNFVPGQINFSDATLAAGESTLITVHVSDANGNLLTDSENIVFNSACVGAGTATITTSNGTTSIDTLTTGTATATYQANGCAPNDTITATATGLNGDIQASGTITISAAAFNAIEFVSAIPDQIGIQGMGRNETTNVTFKLVDQSGGPVSGQLVDFSLSNNGSGINITNPLDQATSNANGEVTAVITSGKVQANFVVTATTTVSTVTYVASSNSISVQDAIPAQNGFSLVSTISNPEALNIVTTVQFTAYVNDRNNNPVPDGDKVNFLAECGNIDSSCTTVNGSCSVNWVSTPINCYDYAGGGATATDGRVAIMAYVTGEESFADNDADGEFTTGDVILTNNAEAYLDYNDSGDFTINVDAYQDFNESGAHNNADALFNGALCVNNCGTTDRIHVYQSKTLIASGSAASLRICEELVLNTVPDMETCPTLSSFTIANNDRNAFYFTVRDGNGNVMPAGTEVKIATTSGKIVTSATYSVPNANPTSTANILAVTTYKSVLLQDAASTAGAITITVTSPGGTSAFGYIDIQ